MFGFHLDPVKRTASRIAKKCQTVLKELERLPTYNLSPKEIDLHKFAVFDLTRTLLRYNEYQKMGLKRDVSRLEALGAEAALDNFKQIALRQEKALEEQLAILKELPRRILSYYESASDLEEKIRQMERHEAELYEASKRLLGA
jgi:hypothetical protein